MLCQRRIPLDDKHRGIAGGVETMTPTGHLVDRERTLVVTPVNVAISTHILPHIQRITQFSLKNDLYPFSLLCDNRYHMRLLSPLYSQFVVYSSQSAIFIEQKFYFIVLYIINEFSATLCMVLFRHESPTKYSEQAQQYKRLTKSNACIVGLVRCTSTLALAKPEEAERNAGHPRTRRR